jgi:hypothetical protein
MGKPTFIIVGAERCGTTSLYENICVHSGVKRASTKEIEFFDRYYDKGIEWYEEQFPRGLTGEATPTYFFNPKVPERIKSYHKKCRIIISLRDNAYLSKYRQQINKGVEFLPLEDALHYESIRISGELQRVSDLPYVYYPSLYVEYAYKDRYHERHLDMWNKSGLNILVLHNWFSNEDETMRKCFKFIGLPYENHEWKKLNANV